MTRTSFSAEAARRALDTLLRNAHERTVLLRLPAPAIAGDDAEELGQAVPLFQDMPLAPAIFRKVYAATAGGGHARRELLLSLETVAALTGSTEFAGANVLFAQAYGVLVDETLLGIERAEEVLAGGIICGYRLILREPVPDL